MDTVQILRVETNSVLPNMLKRVGQMCLHAEVVKGRLCKVKKSVTCKVIKGFDSKFYKHLNLKMYDSLDKSIYVS